MTLSGALEIASCTDPGMVRSHNEDSIASDGDKGLVVLADGMGGYNAGEAEIHDYDTQPGDIYLLCSDGLCDMVSDDDIGLALQTLSSNLKLCAQHLVQSANDNGGRDNVSVILVRVLRGYPAPRGMMGRMMGWFR